MKREFLTISNLLSISRALLAVPFVLVLTLPPEPLRGWAAALLALAALTDYLDGRLARTRNEITEWGKVLDPLADKVGVACAAATLTYIGNLPVWFLSALIARDALILAGGLVIRARTGNILPSNQAGKWTVGVISLALMAALAGVGGVVMTVLLAASTAGLSISFASYALRFAREMAAARHQNGLT
jgi:CDP-diacylglycerol--glycerol-3-phosphate 3-phosphatidyltransferase